MTTWNEAKKEFSRFSKRVESARVTLGCEGKSAWFRGCSSNSYTLTPSLFRRPLALTAIWSLWHSCKTAGWRGKTLKRAAGQFKREWARIPSELLHSGIPDSVHQLSRVRPGAYSDKAGYKRLEEKIRVAIDEGIPALCKRRAPHERDLFTEFSYRDGAEFRSSWHALAAAQHYQAGTRLLDWSDSLLVGLAFAIAPYLESLTSSRLTHRGKLEPKALAEVEHLEEPAVWILNPYHLAAASNSSSLLDPTWDKGIDYHDMFLGDKVRWQHQRPIPLTISWENPRIAAQRGTFTIHGICPLPLEDQVRKTVVAKCKLSQPAALFAAYLVRDVCAFDQFTLNRDRHHLGQSIRLRHLGY